VRRDRLAPVLAVLGGAIVLVVALVVANQIGDHSSKPSASNINVDSVAEMLRGIPQKGIELGNPNAKLTLVEFSDPQCPWCGEWARTVFPSLAQNYVRSGKLRIEYRGLAFLDDYPNVDPKDSDRLLALAQAAGLQNKLWNVVELEFDNQGTENTGYATDALLRGLVKAVDGLDADKAFSVAAAAIPLVNAGPTPSVAKTNTIVQKIKEAQKLALTRVGKRIQTPTFLLGRTGSKKTEIIVGAQPLSEFTKAIDAQLKQLKK
jgi:protein-disulfide isomerase